jgi:hypothetical protein
MALLHRAELRPSKIELITGWVQAQPWFEGDADAALTSVASFRFDDPEGEVGIETLLVRAGDGPVLQVPVSYRAAALDGAEAWLIGTMQHSVLGQRWTYDATGDPAYLRAVATAALTGGSQAEQYHEVDGERIYRDPTAVVVGSGNPGAEVAALPPVGDVSTRHERGSTVVETGDLRLLVARVPGAVANDVEDASAMLSGTWTDQPDPQVLVVVLAR